MRTRSFGLLTAVSLVSVACLPDEQKDEESGCGLFSNCYDSWYSWGDSGGYWDDDVEVGSITGSAGVYIVEAGCDLVWDISGDQCSGCDLGWDIAMDLTSLGSCSFGNNTSGTLEIYGGAAYFSGDYWGVASAGGRSVTWATVGYVYGVGGYTYYYSGAGSY